MSPRSLLGIKQEGKIALARFAADGTKSLDGFGKFLALALPQGMPCFPP